MDEQPKCEVCGALAACGVRDVRQGDPLEAFRTGYVSWEPKGPPHVFCDRHVRDSITYKHTDEQMLQAFVDAAQEATSDDS